MDSFDRELIVLRSLAPRKVHRFALSLSYAIVASLGTTQFPKLTGIGGNCFSPSG
jgi:hypothetical protein